MLCPGSWVNAAPSERVGTSRSERMTFGPRGHGARELRTAHGVVFANALELWRPLAITLSMPVFALTPPVHIRGRDKVICSTEKAADLLRELALQLDDPTTTGLVSRLESVSDPEEAQHAGEEFRAWLGQRNLLMAPPDGDTDVPH
jgi:hypothetical protein